MQIIPAIDLKDNKCVRLSKGKDDTSIVFNKNPEQQAIFFEQSGCRKLHIVDLDAAFGRPELNIKSIKKIRKSISIPIQLGGGIRSELDAKRYFDLGIDNLIIGSLSVNQPDKVKFLVNTYRDRIYISLDIKNDNVMVKGWKEKSKLKTEDIINIYNKLAIKGYVITDIENDGMLRGLNTDFIKDVVNKVNKETNIKKSVIIAGGLTNYNDLENLKQLKLSNLEGIISGKSFYVGNIDLNKAQMILNSDG